MRERCWLAAEATFPFSPARFGCAPRRKQCQPRSRCCCNFSPSGAWRQTLIPKVDGRRITSSCVSHANPHFWAKKVAAREARKVHRCINVLTCNTHYPRWEKWRSHLSLYKKFTQVRNIKRQLEQPAFPEFVFPFIKNKSHFSISSPPSHRKPSSFLTTVSGGAGCIFRRSNLCAGVKRAIAYGHHVPVKWSTRNTRAHTPRLHSRTHPISIVAALLALWPHLSGWRRRRRWLRQFICPRRCLRNEFWLPGGSVRGDALQIPHACKVAD